MRRRGSLNNTIVLMGVCDHTLYEMNVTLGLQLMINSISKSDYL